MAGGDGVESTSGEVPGSLVRPYPVVLTSSFRPGVLLYGLSAAALGLLGLYRGDFTIVFHPVPDALPGRTALAYLAALLLIASGIGIQFPRFRKAGGLLLAVLFVLLGTQWLIRVVSYPELIGTWLGWSEQLALALGGLMVAVPAGDPGRPAVTACRIAFGLLQLVFGLGHFLSLAETVGMTPGWLPPSREFWAIATGVLHFAGGIAFLIGFRPVMVAAMLAAMLCSFALLVWLPAVVANPAAPVPPAGLIVTVAIAGAMLVLFDLLRGRQPIIAGSGSNSG